MSIGTAKPTPKELVAVKHHFIDSLSVTDPYTAGDYEKQVLSLLNELFKNHDVVVMAGGSGLFIKAVCEGFDTFPDTQPGVREKLNITLSEKGIGYLHKKLKAADPEYYAQADLNNPQRVIRALEVFESSGKPFSSYRRSGINKRPFNIIKLGLNMDREVLYDRINRRVNDMVNDGLIDEVKSLLPYRDFNALITVGYVEIFDYLDGKTDLSTAVTLIKQNTRRFAKRQVTWFGKDKEIVWFDAVNPTLAVDMINAATLVLKSAQ
jgi:tRNA dimethylallyltransferase